MPWGSGTERSTERHRCRAGGRRRSPASSGPSARCGSGRSRGTSRPPSTAVQEDTPGGIISHREREREREWGMNTCLPPTGLNALWLVTRSVIKATSDAGKQGWNLNDMPTYSFVSLLNFIFVLEQHWRLKWLKHYYFDTLATLTLFFSTQSKFALNMSSESKCVRKCPQPHSQWFIKFDRRT